MGKDGFCVKVAWIILIFLGFFSCNKNGTKTDLSAESLKIYNLLIYQFYSTNEEETVLINSFSKPIRNTLYYEQLFLNPGIDRKTAQDFIGKNQSVTNIASDFPLDVRFRFLSFNIDKFDGEYRERNRRLKNLMNRVRKLTLYSDKKIIEFSKVGFNERADQAIVSYIIYETLIQDGTDVSDYVIGFHSGDVLLEKRMGPSPHVWVIKIKHPRYGWN